MAIIGTLVALLLPAVQAAREAARRATCVSNLRQIGIGLHNYHDAVNSFPPGCLFKGTRQLAWTVFLLPFIEEGNTRALFNTTLSYSDPANQPATSQVISLYLCPTVYRYASDRQGNYTASSLPITPSNEWACADYGGMFGAGLIKPYANGVMLYTQLIRCADITDGLSHTIMIAEDTGRGAILDGSWADGENIYDQTLQVNTAQDNEIWSDHSGGAQALFSDGSVNFLDESMATTVLSPLCTRANGDFDQWVQ